MIDVVVVVVGWCRSCQRILSGLQDLELPDASKLRVGRCKLFRFCLCSLEFFFGGDLLGTIYAGRRWFTSSDAKMGVMLDLPYRNALLCSCLRRKRVTPSSSSSSPSVGPDAFPSCSGSGGVAAGAGSAGKGGLRKASAGVGPLDHDAPLGLVFAPLPLIVPLVGRSELILL